MHIYRVIVTGLAWMAIQGCTHGLLGAEGRALPSSGKSVTDESQSFAPIAPLPSMTEILPPTTGQPSVAIAQEVLTVASLEQMALATNPTIAQALLRVRALEGKQVQVGLYPNPVLGYIGDEMGNEGTVGQQGAFFRQEVITGGKLHLNRQVVCWEIQQAQQALEVQRQRVINDVRAAAYEVLVAQRTIELNEQLIRVGEAGVKVAESLLKAKEVSRVDVLQARVEYNSARLESENARKQYQAAWRRLAAMLGMPDMPPAPLPDELEQPAAELDWDQIVSQTLAQSPEMAQARAGLERARRALQREYAQRVPDVDLEGGVRYNAPTHDTMAMVQLGVPLQIYNRNQGNIARAQAEVVVADHEIRRVELDLQNRLADAFRRYAAAREQTRRYVTDILPDAKASLDLVQVAYQHGEIGYLVLLTAQRTYFRMNLAYLESLRELWLATTQIQGMLLTGGLQGAGP